MGAGLGLEGRGAAIPELHELKGCVEGGWGVDTALLVAHTRRDIRLVGAALGEVVASGAGYRVVARETLVVLQFAAQFRLLSVHRQRGRYR